MRTGAVMMYHCAACRLLKGEGRGRGRGRGGTWNTILEGLHSDLVLQKIPKVYFLDQNLSVTNFGDGKKLSERD